MKAPNRLISGGGYARRRGVLGLFSLPLFFFLGEGVGVPVMLAAMAAYFSICQFMLSRGRVNAYREDWPIMLALAAIPIMMVSITVVAEK